MAHGKSPIRLLWGGQGVSAVGTEVTVLAIPLIAVLVLKVSPARLGLLVAIERSPALFAGLAISPYIDRRGQRGTLFLTEYGRAALIGSIPLAAAFGRLSYPFLMAIVFLAGCLESVYNTAFSAWVPALVNPRQLIRTNAYFEGLNSVAQVGGPGIGGLLVNVAGPVGAVVADSVSYLFSGLTLHFIKSTGPMPGKTAARGGLRAYLADIRAGLSYQWRSASLRILNVSAAVFNLFIGITLSVEVLYIVRVVRLPVALMGLTMSAGLVGGLLASVSVQAVNARAGTRRTLPAGLLIAAPGPLILRSAAGAAALAPWMVGASLLLNSYGVALYVITSRSIRQTIVPSTIRSRVFAAARVLSRGGVMLGALVGGWLASMTSVGLPLTISALGEACAGCLLAYYARLIPRRLDEANPEAQADAADLVHSSNGG